MAAGASKAVFTNLFMAGKVTGGWDTEMLESHVREKKKSFNC